MKFKILSICFFALSFAFAETNTSTNFGKNIGISLSNKDGTYINVSQGEGSGQTREEATLNALANALSKMKGLSIDVKQDVNQRAHTYLLGYTNVLDNKIQSAAKGRIDSYEITSVSIEPDTKEYVVSVNVYKTLFKRNEKPHIAIFNDSVFKAIGDNILQNITNELVKSKKVTVLDRKSDKYYKAEKNLLKSEDSSSDDLYKLGNVLGTDYMLIFNLRKIGASSNQGSNITVADTQSIKGDVVIDYKLILFATREIKLSDTLTVSILVKENDVRSDEKASAKIAKELSSKLLDELYPLYIAMATDKEVIFEEKLDNGAIYTCTSSNADTSRVQITKSSAKSSSAKILEGKPRLADVCHLESETGKAANYKLGDDGGVNLGF